MDEQIITAVIGMLGSGLGSVLGVVASSKLTQYRLEQLEKKVEAHNNLVTRMYEVEKQEALLEEEIEQLRSYHQ